MIAIGLITGAEDGLFRECCQKLMRAFYDYRANDGLDFIVNVVFHTPLPPSKPEFEGMTLGKISKRDKKVVVAIAVPQEIMGNERRTIMDYLFVTVQSAVEFGIEALRSRRISYNVNDFRDMIESVKEDVSNH